MRSLILILTVSTVMVGTLSAQTPFGSNQPLLQRRLHLGGSRVSDMLSTQNQEQDQAQPYNYHPQLRPYTPIYSPYSVIRYYVSPATLPPTAVGSEPLPAPIELLPRPSATRPELRSGEQAPQYLPPAATDSPPPKPQFGPYRR